jgi:ankyrin repeat protein
MNTTVDEATLKLFELCNELDRHQTEKFDFLLPKKKQPNIEQLTTLLDQGANPNFLFKEDPYLVILGDYIEPLITPLIQAINLEHYTMVKLLLRYKANPNGCSRTNKYPCCFTPLDAACNMHNVPIINLLLDNGAQINPDDTYNTPFLSTCLSIERIKAEKWIMSSEHISKTQKMLQNVQTVIKLLLEHGAHINKLNLSNKSCLFAALTTRNQKNIKHIAEYKKIIALLIENGAVTTDQELTLCHQTNKFEEKEIGLFKIVKHIHKATPPVFFYDETEQSGGLAKNIAKGTINNIAYFYNELCVQEWQPVCNAVYKNQSNNILRKVPLMPKKEQLKIVQDYFLK